MSAELKVKRKGNYNRYKKQRGSSWGPLNLITKVNNHHWIAGQLLYSLFGGLNRGKQRKGEIEHENKKLGNWIKPSQAMTGEFC